MAANQQKDRTIHIGESDRWTADLEQQSDQSTCERHACCGLVDNPCSRAKVVNKSLPTSTIEVENVNGNQSVSEVALEIPKAAILTAHGSLDNVQTKHMVIRQKLDRETARWSRLMCDQFSRRAR